MSINNVQSPIISTTITCPQHKTTIVSILVLHNNKKRDFYALLAVCTPTVIVISIHRLTCYQRLMIHLFRGRESYPRETLPTPPT